MFFISKCCFIHNTTFRIRIKSSFFMNFIFKENIIGSSSIDIQVWNTFKFLMDKASAIKEKLKLELEYWKYPIEVKFFFSILKCYALIESNQT